MPSPAYDEYTKAFHSTYKIINNKPIEDRLKEKCIFNLRRAQAGISKTRVAACVLAKSKYGMEDYFTGVNIEFATSMGIHAEVCALVKAISEGYTEIIAVGETSDIGSHMKPLCGQCRHYFMCVNPEVRILVFDSKTEKTIFDGKLIDLEKEPYIPTRRIT